MLQLCISSAGASRHCVWQPDEPDEVAACNALAGIPTLCAYVLSNLCTGAGCWDQGQAQRHEEHTRHDDAANGCALLFMLPTEFSLRVKEGDLPQLMTC
jgi:hypothetical protein